MLLRTMIAGIGFVALATVNANAEAKKFDAKLIAHAELPAQSFVAPPADAPAMFNMSGRFTKGARVEKLYGIHDERTGLSRPFPGQPLQGFSGIRSLGDDRFLVLTDNGFGSKTNSSDVLLMFNIVKIDWEKGHIGVEKTIFLSDPNRVVPFAIINEATSTRYLTGTDFDIESIQPVGDHYWIGDEFGPWLMEVDANGVVLQVFATEVKGALHRAPENAFLRAPNPGGKQDKANVKRSGGFEGMALAKNGTTLYPLLEKPFYDLEAGAIETKGGKPVLRMFEFDTKTGSWSDTIRFFPLENGKHAIGDFNMIDETRALIIERGSGRGDPREGWSKRPAMFKRVYLVDLTRMNDENVLEKIAYIDLMAITDADGVAPRGTIDNVFSFPFVTIENVDRVDETTIVVANDNNYPFSIGRQEGRADDNEFILLDVADFLNAQ